ncbi:hypothetical protein HDV06_004854 [Boothiomyces sp. JEL0866]|nr:hypothetical protein HDV06_004854 [Boothiomyces sp. JEL0866]
MLNRSLDFYNLLVSIRNDIKSSSIQELQATLDLVQESYNFFVNIGSKAYTDESTTAMIVITLDHIVRLVSTRLESLRLTKKYCEIADRSFTAAVPESNIFGKVKVVESEKKLSPPKVAELDTRALTPAKPSVAGFYSLPFQIDSYTEGYLLNGPTLKIKKHRLLKKTPKFKSRVNFSEEVLEYLYEWINNNTAYPDRHEKEELAKTCGMTVTQVNNWFINTRRRKMKLE